MALITIGSWIGEIWTTLWLSLSTVVYGFITLLYRVFLSVANVNLFSKDIFDKITGRLYIVMSIAMLFIFAYNLVFMIIDPDGKQKGSMTKVVKDTIISLILVVLLPTIFNYLYVAQYHILNSNVIDNIIFDDKDSIGSDCDKFKNVKIEYEGDLGWFAKAMKYGWGGVVGWGLEALWEANGGGGTDKNAQNKLYDYCVSYNSLEPSYIKGATTIPGTIFSAFFYPNIFSMDECEEWLFSGQGSSDVFKDENAKICKNYYYDMTTARYTGTVYPILKDPYLIKKANEDNSPLEFNYIFAFIAGCLACYMYVCYVLKIGVRVAKLGFLQIISPIPIMLRIIPGQNMFKKWLDQIKTTYIDVFIRVAIIDFTLFGISLAPDMINTLFANTFDGDHWIVSTLSLVVVILGLMQFANEAPQLFKDLFGVSGNFALKSPGKQLAENKLAMGAAGMLGGGATSAVKNWNKNKDLSTGARLRSAFGGLGAGAARGAKAGYGSKSFKDLKSNTSGAIDRTLEAGDRRDIRQGSEGGTFGYYKARVKKGFSNWATGESLQTLQNQKKVLEEAKGNYDKIVSSTKDYINSHKSSFSIKGKTIEQYEMQKDKANTDYNNYDEMAYLQQLKTNWKASHHGQDASGRNLIALERQAKSRKEVLAEEYIKANAEYEQAVTQTTDAVISMQRESGESKGNKQIEVNKLDSKGQKMYDSSGNEIKETVLVQSSGQVTNLQNIIETADNYASTNSAEINIARGGNDATDLSGKSDRGIRNALGTDISDLNARIANQRTRNDNGGNH